MTQDNINSPKHYNEGVHWYSHYEIMTKGWPMWRNT